MQRVSLCNENGKIITDKVMIESYQKPPEVIIYGDDVFQFYSGARSTAPLQYRQVFAVRVAKTPLTQAMNPPRR